VLPCFVDEEDQGTALELTVVLKLNQGSTRKHVVIAFGRPFLVLFWAKQKRTIKPHNHSYTNMGRSCPALSIKKIREPLLS